MIQKNCFYYTEDYIKKDMKEATEKATGKKRLTIAPQHLHFVDDHGTERKEKESQKENQRDEKIDKL